MPYANYIIFILTTTISSSNEMNAWNERAYRDLDDNQLESLSTGLKNLTQLQEL